MARLPRFIIPGLPQHVIVRGNNRSEIFRADADYLFFFEKLRAACEKYCCDIHAYVLMTNHAHLLITPSEALEVGKVMQMLGRYYVQYFNHRYERTGTLWEGRYKATLIDSENYLLTCMRYIELNPVRAKMASHPSEYPWSSYSFNAQGMADALVTPHAEYLRLGKSDAERQKAYRELFEYPISENTLDEIRKATNKAWVLGGSRFKQRMRKQLNRRIEPNVRGGDRKSEKFKINRV